MDERSFRHIWGNEYADMALEFNGPLADWKDISDYYNWMAKTSLKNYHSLGRLQYTKTDFMQCLYGRWWLTRPMEPQRPTTPDIMDRR